MSEVIVVTSGKGGVGKTTVAANLGCGLALLGNKVVLIDTDIGLRNLDVVMGLENRIVYNLVDVVEGGCRIKQALIKDKNHQGLYLMPSAQTRDKSSVTPQQMKKLTQELTEEFDYVILDCPAGIEQGFKNAVAGASRAIVVTTPEVSAIRDADGMEKIEMIINRIRPDLVARGDMMSLSDIQEILTVPIIGAVTDEEEIVISSNNGEPVAGKDSPLGQIFVDICRRIMGEDIPVAQPSVSKGLIKRLKSILEKKGK